MTKPYFNDAIAGNSRMLCCFTDKGELIRLFWPNIDYQQHIDKLVPGIFLPGSNCRTSWLNENPWRHCQNYAEDTNILETVYINPEINLKIKQTDFVTIKNDKLIRYYEIENMGKNEINTGFILYSSATSANQDLCGTMFDSDTGSMIHYKHGCYISISADRKACRFQLGNNAYGSASSGELNGCDSIGMMQDGALSWEFGDLPAGGKIFFPITICLSHTLKGVKKLILDSRNINVEDELADTRKYWYGFLNSLKKVDTGIEEVDRLYKRSLLVFKLLSDEAAGGLLASPETDEGFTKCGRYGYCWGRDAAFITGAMDRCGLTDEVGRFFDWAAGCQDDNGSWQQRYYTDGNLAPSWGMQIDETGTLIRGMLKHYEITLNRGFLERMWHSAGKAVEFLISFIDGETGVPGPCYDIWEERQGEHLYSAAAVYGGIMAGVGIAKILDIEESVRNRWLEAAMEIKKAIERNFWDKDRGIFIRSIRLKPDLWGDEYCGNITQKDGAIDASLLGMIIPFEVFSADDPRVKNTAEIIEKVLTVPSTDGIKRYENDNYIGGNPWILTTLWLALYHIKAGSISKARGYFDWAAGSCTELDLLPEQVSRESGRPAWVIPLAWSHAMFVLVLFELIEAGEFNR